MRYRYRLQLGGRGGRKRVYLVCGEEVPCNGYVVCDTVFAYEGQGSQYIRYPMGIEPPVMDVLDVSFKLFVKEHTDTFRGLMIWGNDFQSASDLYFFMCFVQTDNKLYFRARNNGGTATNFPTNIVVPTGEWLDCYASFDTATNEVTVGIKNHDKATYTFDTFENTYTGQDMYLMGGPTRSWSDKLQLYNAKFSGILNNEETVYMNVPANEPDGLDSINHGTGGDGVCSDEAVHQVRWDTIYLVDDNGNYLVDDDGRYLIL